MTAETAIADTAMGLFKFAPHDPAWFQDRAVVRRALDALLDTPLGSLVNHAGIIRQAKKAPNRKTIHALVATGEDEIYALQDGKRPVHMSVVLSIVHGALAVDARCYREGMRERPTVMGDLAAIAIALRDCGVFAGLREGFVTPLVQSDASYDFERNRPRVSSREWDLRNAAVLDLLDVRFHTSGFEDSNPIEVKLAKSTVPKSVKRTEKSGLVTLEWVESLLDKKKLDRACEAHEDWLDRNLS
jgi:hypothetical protein